MICETLSKGNEFEWDFNDQTRQISFSCNGGPCSVDNAIIDHPHTLREVRIFLNNQIGSRFAAVMVQCKVWNYRNEKVTLNPGIKNRDDAVAAIKRYVNEQGNFSAIGNNGSDTPPAVTTNKQYVNGKKSNHETEVYPSKMEFSSNLDLEKIAESICGYLNGFVSDDDEISPNTSIDEKLNKLYKWPINNRSGRVKDIPLPPITHSIQLDQSAGKRVNDTICLKNSLHRLLENIDVDDKALLCRWFVGKWGNVRMYNPRDNGYKDISNDQKERFKCWIETFKSQDCACPPFTSTGKNNGGIASWSKVACLINPREYAIYDSRVATTINYILYCSKDTTDLSFYFPKPPSQNSKINFTDDQLKKLLKLADEELEKVLVSNKKEKVERNLYSGYKWANREFCGIEDDAVYEKIIENRKAVAHDDDVYAKYLSLLGIVASQLFPGDDNKLQKAEMILFALADHKELFLEVIRKMRSSNNQHQ